MFVTLPEHKIAVPEALAHPGAQDWKVVGISLHCAWFVLTLRPIKTDEQYVTCLLAWDFDVIETIDSFGAEVASLLWSVPPNSSAGDGWRSISVTEVWWAIDPHDRDSLCVLLVGSDGLEYSGPVGVQVVGLKRQRLVARVAPLASRNSASSDGAFKFGLPASAQTLCGVPQPSQ